MSCTHCYTHKNHSGCTYGKCGTSDWDVPRNSSIVIFIFVPVITDEFHHSHLYLCACYQCDTFKSVATVNTKYLCNASIQSCHVLSSPKFAIVYPQQNSQHRILWAKLLPTDLISVLYTKLEEPVVRASCVWCTQYVQYFLLHMIFIYFM